MREANFGAVDEAIAEGFEEGERRLIVGVEEDVLFDLRLELLVQRTGEAGMGSVCTWRALRLSMPGWVPGRML